MAWTAPRTWTDGEFVTAAIMNPHIRDNQLAEGPHLIVRKTSDQSVVSSTAFVDDSALILPVAANEVWLVNLILRYEGGSAGDYKFSFGIPASSRIDVHVAHQDTVNATTVSHLAITVTDGASANLSGGGGAGTPRIVPITGVYVGAGTAGNVTFRFAQVVSDATAAKTLTHSTLWAVKLA